MKKKIMSAAIVAVLTITAGWNYQQNKQSVELSDLAIANVEALANPEHLQPGWENKDCYNEWGGGMGGSMNRVCKCWTPGSTYLFCN